MELMKQIWESAKNNRKKIVLPEGDEERTLVASQRIKKEEGLADVYLVGSEQVIREKAEALGVNLEGVNIVDPETSDKLDTYINEFYELRKAKGMTVEKAGKIVRDPLYFGTMMVKWVMQTEWYQVLYTQLVTF